MKKVLQKLWKSFVEARMEAARRVSIINRWC
jgi:hypothetical protein